MRERKGLGAPVPDSAPVAAPTVARPRTTAIAGAAPDQVMGAISLVIGTRSWPLVGTRLLVGRAGGYAGAHVEVNDASTSRRHAELVATDAGWLLRDLGSTNGTWSGDARLAPGDAVAVVPGVAIRFGTVTAELKQC